MANAELFLWSSVFYWTQRGIRNILLYFIQYIFNEFSNSVHGELNWSLISCMWQEHKYTVQLLAAF